MDFSFTDLPQSWWHAWEQIWHLFVAFILVVPIGWDREQRDYSAGVRTFPIVSMASCVILMIGQSIADGQPEAEARALYGVVTGMGFLGAGAILKEGQHVRGLTTAASLWATAAVGLAVAADEFVLAVVLAMTNFVLLKAKHGNSDPDQPPKRRHEAASDSPS
ncbi:MAG: MgtC/SapB family protein [Planctomycetaceae bacterium]